MNKTSDMTVIEKRFWRKVRKTEGCWIWMSGVNSRGYGRFRNPLRDGQGRVFAHRFSWEIRNGPIPDGMLVLHKCDNPPCVNPDHLFIGTHVDNAIDCIAKGRHQRDTIPESYRRGPEWSARLKGKKMPKLQKGQKLTREQAEIIKTSKIPAIEIAKMYDIDWSYVYKLRRGYHWT